MQKRVTIGGLTLPNPTVMAPLAGITNSPFRRLALSGGCGLVCSEMVSANGLLHGSRKTLALLEASDREHPLAVQIFGSDPDIMAEAAGRVEAAGADIVDINFGCSVRKIVKTGSGVALMRDLDRSRRLLEAVRRRVRVPLTIKIRTGWDATGDQAAALTAAAQDCGVDAIAVHPRTAGQGFSGRADWAVIARLKSQLSIPVIGNGDIWKAEDALRMRAVTGCDAVMVGRAAIGNPWIFSQTLALFEGRKAPEVTPRMQLELILNYLQDSVSTYGEFHACRMMRSRLGWFVKGLPNSSRFRESIRHIASEKEAAEKVKRFMAPLL